MVNRSIPREPPAPPWSEDSYDNLVGNVSLAPQFYFDYEHIPSELLPVAKKLQVRWPIFNDQDVPGRVAEWETCYRSSTLLRGANGAMDAALSANDNAGVDALGNYWKGKVESYMDETSSSSLQVQNALVIAGLQVLNYKNHTLEVMHTFYQQEQRSWFQEKPSNTDYRTSGDNLRAKLALVNASIADCTRQITNANGVLENVKSKLMADVAMFESKNITTWGPDRK
jgi:hypothetical protein